MAKLFGNVVILLAGFVVMVAGATAVAIIVAYCFVLVMLRRLRGTKIGRPALTAGA